MHLFRAAAACGITIEMLDQTFGHHVVPFLPKLGSPLAVLGLVFGIAFVLVEFWDSLTAVRTWAAIKWRWLRQWFRRRATRRASPHRIRSRSTARTRAPVVQLPTKRARSPDAPTEPPSAAGTRNLAIGDPG